MVRLAGSTPVGDAVYGALFHAHAERLLERCHAVLRAGGPSATADALAANGARPGLRIFDSLGAVPGLTGEWPRVAH